MGYKYKPTLGGLKKVQEFLDQNGRSLPIFQMNIHDVEHLAGRRRFPGQGRMITIDEAIRKYGAMYEMVDVRLANEQGDKFIQFNSLDNAGLLAVAYAIENLLEVTIERHMGDPMDHEFKDFLDSNGRRLMKLARWGKMKVSVCDWLKFHFFPKCYSTEVFWL